jgi:hypothetical protein
MSQSVVPFPGAEPEPSVLLQLDASDSLGDVIEVLALEAFAAGRQPYARSRRLERVRPDALLRPSGARVLRTVRDESGEAVLACGDGWTLRSGRWRSANGVVEVTAVSDELAEAVLEDAVRDATEPAPPEEHRVEMGFCTGARAAPSAASVRSRRRRGRRSAATTRRLRRARSSGSRR